MPVFMTSSLPLGASGVQGAGKAIKHDASGLRGSFRGTSLAQSIRPVQAVRNVPKISAVATPSKPPSSKKAARSKVELIKEDSDFLRHPLMEELVSEATSINEEAAQLMKFHGSYMQDHREKRSFGKGKHYQFMMRTRQPAGRVPNQLYLCMDDLANEYGNGTLRLTTRQAYQLHGVLKKDLKTVFSSVIKSMGSTLGACGDVNRNVMAPAVPYTDKPEYVHATQVAEDIADLLGPQSGAYYDVWLDGEKFMSQSMENPEVTKARMDNSNGTNFEGSPEPIYGNQFLPRKFKIAVTVPGDNSVDIYTNDIGVVVISNAAGEVEGYNLMVGGGMGRSHRNNETFPRLATHLGFCKKEDLYLLIKAIVCVQRDYGRRDDRKQARLKYLVETWGIERFTSVVEQYYGRKVEPYKPLPKWEFKTYYGWGEQGDGKLYYGVFVANGRLKGDAKKALRLVIERYELPVSLTPNQDLILCDVDPAWKSDIMATLVGAGVSDPADVDGLDKLAMACPALPLCGLAIGEAERGLPDINKRVRALLTKVGLADESFIIRMTGCPNGCARPYMAELGFVGDGPNTYQVYLGGSPDQTRLATVFKEKVKVNQLEATLEPLFWFFKTRRTGAEESFGDFCDRVGFEVLEEYISAYVAPPTIQVLPKVGLKPEVFAKLQSAAEQKGTTLSDLASDILDKEL